MADPCCDVKKTPPPDNCCEPPAPLCCPKPTGKSNSNRRKGSSGRGAGAPGSSFVIPTGYGYVVLTAVGSIGMVAWLSMKVAIARDEMKIPYPQMYSDNVAFNCVLRVHQSTLESYPQFLLLLMIGGLEMPYFCALGGCVWIAGRIMHAKGYYSGDASKRARGTISVIGMLMLAAATIKFGFKHLTS